jgi:hypothetical protein
MPANTANGYPYAEPTDPLVQWPATSQALAEKIDDTITDAVYAARIPVSTPGWAQPVPAGYTAIGKLVFLTGQVTIDSAAIDTLIGVFPPPEGGVYMYPVAFQSPTATGVQLYLTPSGELKLQAASATSLNLNLGHIFYRRT